MKQLAINTGVGFTSLLGGFVGDALVSISVWLIVMFWVIIADLFAGVFKCYKTSEDIRISKGMRDTMGKMATYFAFVVAVVFVSKATEIDYITKYSCLAVIVGEGISIASNLLKAHGYELNTNAVLKEVFGRVSVPSNIIKKEDNQ